MRTLHALLEDIAIGYEEETSLVQRIANVFIQKEETLSLSESCTGGAISKQITSLAGVSAFFMGSTVPYATKSKSTVLGVDKELVEDYSVVSKEVAEAMAVQSQKLFNTNYAVSTTGIAGPTQGDSKDEVGTVFIAIAGPKGVYSEKYNFGKPRERVVARATNKALEMLLKEILKN
jgi:nicotinamide-nucleotide amidase